TRPGSQFCLGQPRLLSCLAEQERGEQEAASHGRAHHSEPAATDQDAPADDQDPLAVAAWEAMAATAREGPRSAQQAEDLRDTPWDASGGSRAAAAGLSANGLSMRCYGGRHGRAPSSRLLTGNRMINRKLLIVNTLLRSVTEAPRVAAAPRSTSWHIPGHSPSDLAGTARWSAAAQPARPAAPQQHRADAWCCSSERGCCGHVGRLCSAKRGLGWASEGVSLRPASSWISTSWCSSDQSSPTNSKVSFLLASITTVRLVGSPRENGSRPNGS